MHRRRFITAAIVTLAASGRIATLAQAPAPTLDGAEGFAAVTFRGLAEDEIRSVWVRVSRWPDDEAAETGRGMIVAGAGSDLPDGEFYQTDPEELPDPDLPSDIDASLLGWTTTVGVAAYRTGWALLAMRRESLVWAIVVGAADLEIAADLTSALATGLAGRELTAGGDLASLLPDEDDLPAELQLVSRVSTDAPLEEVPDATPE